MMLSTRLISNTRMTLARSLAIRSYTVVPSTPYQNQPVQEIKSNQEHNTLHALYNNENQSVLDHHLNSNEKQRSLSDEHETFTPTFNAVFDE
ncbi:hypothetical protein K501DRAFT_103951 [Backusella circina FSU 941]|nr:hypothetical protein K501DRAFT_103951 [Backusella circina FSU 941]